MIEIESSHLIIHLGNVYGLTTKERFCPEALSYHPCDFCELLEFCKGNDPQLCTTFEATTEEFYVRCGVIEIHQQTGRIQIRPFDAYNFV